jgi:linoleoyl-CoA desaturase
MSILARDKRSGGLIVFMKSLPRFVRQKDSLQAELRHRINDYFEHHKISPRGNIGLHLKAIFFVGGFVALYIHLVFFTPSSIILGLFEAILLGAFTSAIGFNVMHDGAHGSFSKHAFLNNLAGLSLNFLGANVFMWKTKHNVVHHTFTNIEGVDDDLNARPFLRLSPGQKRYGIHRYQHLYFIFVYSLLYIYWIFFTDYKKYFTGVVGEMPVAKMTWVDQLSFWGFKALHLGLFVILPIYTIGFLPWLVGFLVYTCTAGILLSIVFQMAHTVADTHFPELEIDNRQVEEEWAVHQLQTTANFATRNLFLSWFLGGLNFQIEHHLSPQVSHVHYPAISGIVRQVCLERGIPYIEYPKFRDALASHVKFLKRMGRA